MKLKVLQEGVGLPLPHPDRFKGRQVYLLLQAHPRAVGFPMYSVEMDPGYWAAERDGVDLGSILWPTDSWAIVEWAK